MASAARREGGPGRAGEGRRSDTGPGPRRRRRRPARPAAPDAGASAARANWSLQSGEARWLFRGPEVQRPPNASGAGHAEVPRGEAGKERRCRDWDSLPEVGRVGRKQNVRRPRGWEGHVRSGRRAGTHSRGSGEGPAAGPARVRPPRGGPALRRGRVCLRLRGRPRIAGGGKRFFPHPRPQYSFIVLRLLGEPVFAPT